jgi:hypothetical protein
MRKTLLLLALGFAGMAGIASAQDDALSARDSVPVGERLASYLQSYFNTFSSLEALKPGQEALKANIFYTPSAQVITVLVVGSLADPEAAKPVLTTALKVLLRSAQNVKSSYGFTLSEKDLALLYFSAPARRSILTLKAGLWTEPAAVEPPEASPSPSGTPTP